MTTTTQETCFEFLINGTDREAFWTALVGILPANNWHQAYFYAICYRGPVVPLQILLDAMNDLVITTKGGFEFVVVSHTMTSNSYAN